MKAAKYNVPVPPVVPVQRVALDLSVREAEVLKRICGRMTISALRDIDVDGPEGEMPLRVVSLVEARDQTVRMFETLKAVL